MGAALDGSRVPANGIDFSAGIFTRRVWDEVDRLHGNNNGIPEEPDFDAFYVSRGVVLGAESEAQVMLYRTGSPAGSMPGLGNPTSIKHAARKMQPQQSGAGRRAMFESKLGQRLQVEHRHDDLNKPAHYGAPYRFYKTP